MTARVFIVAALLLLGRGPVRADDPDVLRIGFVDSLLQESSPTQRKLLGKEFSELVKNVTGLKSAVLEGINPATAARQLDQEKWHLGVFHGVEYARLQAKHPQLKPLMVTTTQVSPVRAVLLVKKDGTVGSFADLKGKDVAMLRILHCRLFTDKATGGGRDYFASVLQTRDVEEALDSILLGKTQGAIVDTPTLAFYKKIQPGRFDRLKIAAESEPFPPAVIVYHQGTLSDAMLKRLRDGMLKVKDSDKGREALTAFRITGLQLAPEDFQKSLTNIDKAYPNKEAEQ